MRRRWIPFLAGGLLAATALVAVAARAPIAIVDTRLPWPAVEPSVVYGPADAPTGGQVVVGILIPTKPSKRLVDLLPRAAYEKFLAEDAEDARLESLGRPIRAELPTLGLGPTLSDDGFAAANAQSARESALATVAREVEKATSVRVVLREVLASECDGVPLVLVDGGVDEDDDATRLLAAIAAGTRVVTTKFGKHDVGEVPAGAPGVKYPPTLLDLVRDVSPAVIRESPLVRRLPSDPLAVVSARREGDDVVVTLVERPATATLRDVDDRIVRQSAPTSDGSLRFSCPDPALDPRTHRLVVSWTRSEPSPITLRRAYPIIDLVGTADRRVLSARLAEAGATFAPRVLFVNSKTGAPMAGWHERLALRRGDVVLSEASGQSDDAGSVDALLRVPADTPPGPAELLVGGDRFPVEVTSSVRLSVVTERSLYRPTDDMHVRLMAHRAADGHPVPDADVSMKLGSVEKRVKTSAHGITSATFRLVDARPGRTSIEAKCLGATAQATFDVGAFETPTFVVEWEPRSLALRAGERAPVRVRARYVNGGPVVGAEASFDASSDLDVDSRRGTTDADGSLSWAVAVDPKAEARSRAATVWVTDADGRAAKAILPVTITGLDEADAISIAPLDEPVVGMPCRFEVRGPAATFVAFSVPGDRSTPVTLDASGRGVLTLTPDASATQVAARVGDGPATRLPIEAIARNDTSLLLLPDRRTWRVGETFAATILGPDGPAYIDLARDGTTLLGRSAVVSHGRARVELSLTPDLAGVIATRVWRLRDEMPVGSSAAVIVARGNSLRVAARVVQDGLRPGDTAAIDVDVADPDGKPTAGVLGYWGVDEALLAIAPWRVGGEEVFDVMPAARADDLRDVALDTELRRDVAFAAARHALAPPSGWAALGGELPIRDRASVQREIDVAAQARKRLAARVASARRALLEAFARVPLDEVRTSSSLREMLRQIVDRGDLDSAQILDPWGTPIAMSGARAASWIEHDHDRVGWYSIEWGYSCRSAGPDLVWGTADDLEAVWRPHEATEVAGRLGRFLLFLAARRAAAVEHPFTLDVCDECECLGASFEGPANNGLIGIGGGAGGAFKGRGGHRNLRAGGGGQKSDEESVHVRRDFSPTLCFVPEAIVGPDGKAHVEIALKDAITTWRMRLVASAADGATGTAETAIRVAQPLHVEPWIAPHLTVGDALELPVGVRNETDAQADVTVSLTTSREIEVVGKSQGRVAVPPGGTGAVTFRIVAVAPGSAKVRVDARSASSFDAVERIIDVRRLARAVVATQSGTVSAGHPWSPAMAAEAPTHPTDDRVSFFPSPLADVLGGFEGLIACPHG